MNEEQIPAQAKSSNRLREFREELLMTRMELARRAGISLRTVWSAENGDPCRLLTKRKILQALGVPKNEHRRVFPNG